MVGQRPAEATPCPFPFNRSKRANMRACIVIASLGFLLSIEPVAAQSTYSLSVSRHRDVALTEQDVDAIFANASRMLKKELGHVDTPNDVACNVTFKRKGP